MRSSSRGRGIGFPAAAQLPVYLTPLVGRGREVEEVCGLLRTGRLVSLVGAGGSGKTRLAAAVAGEVRGRHPGGVAWIDLAPLSDPALAARHVAATLGIREHPGRTATDSLIELVGRSAVLLVLDNCEHLLGACAVLVDALLRGCPALRVLTTSRQALGITGEKAWLVPPLTLPAPGEAVEEAGAVQLFVQRAGDVLPGFALTEGNAAAVVQICRRLDGLPLAIELAAARVKLLPPEQLAARLDGVLSLLTSRSHTVLPRHRTLRALIDWSYDLLSADERLLLERLAVFAGGFTLEAAEGVAADDGLPAGELLDLLAALVDRSLVSMRESRGEARYVLLEMVRQYAQERCGEEAAAELTRRRHAHYFAGYAEHAAARLQRPGQLEWLTRLEVEHDDVRAALAWSLSAGEAELALRLCVAMRDFWRLRGHLSEGVRWTESALRLPSGSDFLRARALVGVAVLGRMQGEYLSLLDRLAEGEGLARRTGDRAALAEVLTHLGTSLRDRHELDTARERLDEAISLWRELGDAKGLTLALGVRASISLARRETALARALRLEAVEVSRRTGDPEDEARSLLGLGEVARMEGDLDGARAYYERSLELFGELGDRWHAAAARHNLGWVEAEAGRLGAAYEQFSECIDAFRGAGNPFGLTLCLFGFARLLHESDDSAAAAVALSVADAEVARVGVLPAAAADVACCERARAGVEGALDPERLARAREEGTRLDLAAGLAYAQQRLDAVLPRRSRAARASAPVEPGQARAAAGPPRVAASPAALPPDLGVRALGPLQILLGERPLEGDAFGSSKPRELLLLLLCHPEGCAREQVGLAFWPDSSAAQVKNSFHVTLHRLRKALEHPEWVVAAGDRYRLDPSLRIDFDAARFEAETRAVLREQSPGSDAEERLAAALALYRGEFLEGEVVGDWHLEVRDRLRRLHGEGLLALGGLRMAAERFAEAADAFQALLARDRLHEEACRRLMVCHARTGERVQAMRLYENLSVLLREELSTEPDEATTVLYERLQRAEAL